MTEMKSEKEKALAASPDPPAIVSQNVSASDPGQSSPSAVTYNVEDGIQRATTESPTAVLLSTTNASPPPQLRSRSVNDYNTEEELRRALLNLDLNSSAQTSSSPCYGQHQHHHEDREEENRDDINQTIDTNWDWALSNYDEKSTVPQNLREEIQRLQVLKSYHLLDCDREQTFERITGFTSRVFSVPICLVSLVDLGRQWFMSNRGLGEVRETPRKLAFCAHAIRSKQRGVFIVKDATQDCRFKDTALVTGPPHIRFYAGAPLVCPEGYKLGTLCIIDDKPRLQGLTDDECSTLMDMAATVVKTMVDRRKLNTTRVDRTAHMIACAAHDLLTPLTGVHLTLSLLKDDTEVKTKLCEHAKELVHTAARSADTMLRICQSSALGFPKQKNNANSMKSANSINMPMSPAPVSASSTDPNHCCVDMKEFCKSLHLIMDPLPKRVPCVISIDKSVPSQILTDELKILRSSLNFLSYACSVSETESIYFRVFPSKECVDQLVFECEDTGKDIDKQDQDGLFTETHDDGENENTNRHNGHYISELGLVSIASQIDSLGGKYGFRPRHCFTTSNLEKLRNGKKTEKKSGSIFWFSIPIILPRDKQGKKVAPLQKSIVSKLPPREPTKFKRKGSSNHDLPRCNSGVLAETLGKSPFGKRFTSQLNSPWFSNPKLKNNDSSTKVGPGNRGSNNSSGAVKVKKQNLGKRNDSFAIVRTSSRKNLSFAAKPAPTSANKQPLFATTNGLKNMTRAVTTLKQSVQLSAANKPLFSVVSSSSQQHGSKNITISGSKIQSNGKNHSTASSLKNQPTGRQKKALVIEDSTVVSKCLSMALKRLGYEVVQAMNGLIGLQELKKTMFDVCLCDFLMPVMDGVACVQSFREWEKNSPSRASFHQYIVGISAHACKSDIEKGLNVGMDDFRAKPVTYKVLTSLHESLAIKQVSSILDKVSGYTTNHHEDGSSANSSAGENNCRGEEKTPSSSPSSSRPLLLSSSLSKDKILVELPAPATNNKRANNNNNNNKTRCGNILDERERKRLKLDSDRDNSRPNTPEATAA